MITTPSGRKMGRRPDTPDKRDQMFASAHPSATRVQLPPSVDLRSKLGLPCWDQGDESSCGAHMGSAFISYLFPELRAAGGASRHQIYWGVRQLEGTGDEDAGVETRDVFKVMTKTGAGPETLWPYNETTFVPPPPATVLQEAAKYRLSRYSRLTSASNYLQCLATGFPFGLGVLLHESFDDEQTSRTGIMRAPQGKKDKVVGGHDVLCEGYILNFKSDPLFKVSGVAPEQVSDEMLIIRNSWGPTWSPHYRGHFLMPLQYAMDTIDGNDAWTGRR